MVPLNASLIISWSKSSRLFLIPTLSSCKAWDNWARSWDHFLCFEKPHGEKSQTGRSDELEG